MTATYIDPISKAVEAAESTLKLEWNLGFRDQFLKDLKREIENVNGRFRNRSNGASIDVQEYIKQKLQHGIYVRVKPNTIEKYASPFKARDSGTKQAHATFTKSFLQKALRHEGIVFNPGFEEKAVDMISKSFLATDDEKGLRFIKLNDSEIGCLPGSERYEVNELLNHLSLAGWVDEMATKISKNQHRGELRKIAAGMLPVGSKSDTIEKQVDELFAFEARALRTGKKIPHIGKDQMESEFKKFHELNTEDKGMANVRARQSLAKIDDLMDLKLEVRKVVVQPEISLHEGF